MTYSVKEFDDRIEIRNPDGDVIRTEDKPFPVPMGQTKIYQLGLGFKLEQSLWENHNDILCQGV